MTIILFEGDAIHDVEYAWIEGNDLVYAKEGEDEELIDSENVFQIRNGGSKLSYDERMSSIFPSFKTRNEPTTKTQSRSPR